MQIHRYVLDDHGVKTRITQKELTNLKISNPTLDAIFEEVYGKIMAANENNPVAALPPNYPTKNVL